MAKLVATWRVWVGTNGNVFAVATVLAATVWVAMNWGDQVGPTILDTAVMAFATAWITSKGAAIKKRTETVEARQAAVEEKVEALEGTAEAAHPTLVAEQHAKQEGRDHG